MADTLVTCEFSFLGKVRLMEFNDENYTSI